jgi:hypothetical protein
VAGGFAGWLAGVTAAEIVTLVSAAGWLARRVIRSQEATQAEVRALATYVAVDKVIGPRVQTQLDDLGDIANENTRRLDVLADWRRSHEAWCERHAPR